VFGQIDHVGVAVSDLDRAIALYQGTFGMPLVHRETVAEQGVEAVLLDVGDIDAALARLAEVGVELIDREPRIGIRGSRVAFLHPKSTEGVLTELVEPAMGHE
jgi:methylmalonyl-CoA/ethylmalonyl-CoA epimerase